VFSNPTLTTHPIPTGTDFGTARTEREETDQITIMPAPRGPVPVLEKRDLPQEVLNLLDEKPTIHTSEDFLGIPQPEIKAAIDKLKSRSMLQYETSDTEQVILTPEGTTICEEGSHEYKVWDAVRQNGRLPIKELPVGSRAALAHMGTMEKSRC
jgi:phenylalanyl-tRNA synthetase alpha chain